MKLRTYNSKILNKSDTASRAILKLSNTFDVGTAINRRREQNGRKNYTRNGDRNRGRRRNGYNSGNRGNRRDGNNGGVPFQKRN